MLHALEMSVRDLAGLESCAVIAHGSDSCLENLCFLADCMPAVVDTEAV